MNDKELYKQILGINDPWTVEKVDLKIEENKVEVYLGKLKGFDLPCPECESYSPVYDHIVLTLTLSVHLIPELFVQ